MSESTPGPEERTAWLSRGFEELAAKDRSGTPPAADEFDVVIVGSGYGGAIAAAHLAGCTVGAGRRVKVAILERGKEYLPGMFPPRLADLAGHVRFSTEGAPCARGEREGLFDVRIGSDVSAVVANGLGGGSLINAGVMERPGDDVFARHEWPKAIRDDLAGQLDEYFACARRALGADVPKDAGGWKENTVEHASGDLPAKFLALKQLAATPGGTAKPFRAASITVALEKGRASSAGVRLDECLRCGDCATGCNHGAKDSLDVNLLRTAKCAGAEIFTGATVLRIGPVRERNAETGEREVVGWILDVVHTETRLRERQGGVLPLRAAKVILAAGTFGSTEILLRSRSDPFGLSSQLGQRFSSNGDMIAVAYDQRARGKRLRVNAIADENDPPSKRGVGPTITGIIDLRGAKDLPRVVVEEMAVPGPLRRVFEEIVTTGHVLRGLGRIDDQLHDADGPQQDPCAVEKEAIESSSIFAVMGDDGAGGALELVGGDGEADGDGAIRVRWPEARDHSVFRGAIEALHALGTESGVAGEVQPNPAWQLLPDDMQFLFDDKRGPLTTVHPLGGCPMGDAGVEAAEEADAADRVDPGTAGDVRLKARGVVNDLGQVFDVTPGAPRNALYGSLVVLDGSIIPTSLGINPSLTIAALALRATLKLRELWRYAAPAPSVPEPCRRPVFQHLPDKPRTPVATEAEFIERMSGDANLTGRDGSTVAARVELTLHFRPVELRALMLPVKSTARPNDPAPVPMKRMLEVDPGKSRLRVFLAADWYKWRNSAGRDEDLEKDVQIAANLQGSLAFLHREPSTYGQRRCRALRAWFVNRGLRDTWQTVARKVRDWFTGAQGPAPPTPMPDPAAPSFCDALPFVGGACRSLRKRLHDLFALASHGGEVRQFEYALTIGVPVTVAPNAVLDASAFERDRAIAGRKRLTYGRCSNPWRQLTRMSLDRFPGLQRGGTPHLELDTRYLTQLGMPLMRILAQQDEPSAIADLGSLAGYFLRLLLLVHVWSFRKPDPADPGEPQRLPGKLKGLPSPEITEIDMGQLPDGTPVRARLTRYPRPRSKHPPLLLIPGYSASGTTFAHPALDPHAAGYFGKRGGRDVWILDMRTSCGMPTARYPWAFEDVALTDIPAAIDHIWQATIASQSAEEKQRRPAIDVFAHCMGSVMFSMALLAPPEPGDPYFREREALPARVGKVVLSQIGPVVVFTPENVFRAYLMSYLRAFLPLAHYEFRIGPAPSLTDQLIDRLLATMPYPENEFGIENPWWPPWKRTPWVGSRHRMDALYGRDFNVENMTPEVLDAIDDLFGPLSTDTVSQAIHFARLGVLTNRAGRNVFVTRRNLLERWAHLPPRQKSMPESDAAKATAREPPKRPTLSIHGVDNGLYDIATLARMEKLFETDLALKFEKKPFEHLGHQDSLIGTKARDVFEYVLAFLDRKDEE